MKKYIIEYRYDEKYNAGSKARDDIRYILEELDYKTLLLDRPKNVLEKIVHALSIGKNIKYIEDNSVICIQWPLASKKYILPLINELKRKNCKIIVLIHDLTMMRNDNLFKGNEEIKILNEANCIICHNLSMKKFLEENGIKRKIIELNIFDYIINTEKLNKYSKNKRSMDIAFAGNLNSNKSGFLYKIKPEMLGKFNMNLYGLGIQENALNNKMKYMGKFKPEELPFNLKGDFGLVWDGPECNSCVGAIGEYLKINNPHKASLYIASGLPIITWKESAIAQFIEDNKLGLTLNNLNELQNINISDEEYFSMKENVELVAKKICNGLYTKQSFEKALEYIEMR